MSVITYPVEIKQYQVEVYREKALIWLKGVEQQLQGAESGAEVRHAGRVEFILDVSGAPRDFVDRGGGLYLYRSMKMLSRIISFILWPEAE